MDLGQSPKLTFTVKRKNTEILIELIKIPKDELKRNYSAGALKCIATTKRVLKDKKLKEFKSLTTKVPSGIEPLIGEVLDDMDSAINLTMRTIIWKLGLANAHNFIRSGNALMWSFNGTEWNSVPGQISLNISFGLPFKKEVDSKEFEAIQALLTSKIEQPLGHELFSEAWAQKQTNPRSALIIGVAAAEAGFKEFATKMIPEASWILQNIPSPPLKKMLEEFLPNLPVKLKFNDKSPTIPEEILNSLQKGITIRNNIVHGGDYKLKVETVEKILRSIRNLLYLLDYYNGQQWAMQIISPGALKIIIRNHSGNQ